MEPVKRSVIARGWWWEMTRWSSEAFLNGIENTVYDTVKVDTCHSSVQITNSVTMICQCRSISCNKCTALFRSVGNEESIHV